MLTFLMLCFFIIFAVIAYLTGSISTSVLLCKMQGLPDPRTQGSGNAGASNVSRFAPKSLAAAVLMIDMLKGFLPVIVAYYLGMSSSMLPYLVVFAVLGHVFPVFFDFKGGKGVATALGGLFALSFWLGIFVSVVWLIVIWLTSYASLSSLIAFFVAPIIAMIFMAHDYLAPLLFIAFLMIWTHRHNIKRLLSGDESKLDIFKRGASQKSDTSVSA